MSADISNVGRQRVYPNTNFLNRPFTRPLEYRPSWLSNATLFLVRMLVPPLYPYFHESEQHCWLFATFLIFLLFVIHHAHLMTTVLTVSTIEMFHLQYS